MFFNVLLFLREIQKLNVSSEISGEFSTKFSSKFCMTKKPKSFTFNNKAKALTLWVFPARAV